MIDTIKKIFKRKHNTPLPTGERLRVGDGTSGMGQGVEPVPLRIEGVKPAPLTAEPDDAELAAQALLESLCDVRSKMEDERCKMEDVRSKMEDVNHQPSAIEKPSAISHHTSEYYHALAERIRTARSAEARLVMRLLASVEEQLAEPTALYRGQWGDTERKLYRAMDVAEREGGELHRRWQHCLANVLVRQMEEERENAERRMKNEESSEQRESPDETPSQNPTEGRTTNPTEGRLAMPNEGRPADTTLETSSQTVLPVTEAAINQP